MQPRLLRGVANGRLCLLFVLIRHVCVVRQALSDQERKDVYEEMAEAYGNSEAAAHRGQRARAAVGGPGMFAVREELLDGRRSREVQASGHHASAAGGAPAAGGSSSSSRDAALHAQGLQGMGESALIKVLAESIGPALSHSSQEVLLLRQENRRLLDRLEMRADQRSAGGEQGEAREGAVGETVGELQRRLKAEAETKASLVADLVALRQQLEHLQDENDAARASLEAAEKRVKALEEETASLQAERAAFIEQHGGAFEAEIATALSAAEEAREDLRRVRAEYEEEAAARGAAEERERDTRRQLEEIEQEFLVHKHMAGQTQMSAEAAAQVAEEELQGLREANRELETAKGEMESDLQAALMELQVVREECQKNKELLAAERQMAVGRFKLWEQELDDRAQEVDALKMQLQVRAPSAAADTQGAAHARKLSFEDIQGVFGALDKNDDGRCCALLAHLWFGV